MIEAHEGTPTGRLVHIQHADRTNSYYCPLGHEVRPIQGAVLPWHYRHTTEDECAYLQDHPSEGWTPPTP
jgi:hypothetical protein